MFAPQILMEFELKYPNIDSNAFLKKWPQIQEQLRGVLEIDESPLTLWPNEIEEVLLLQKMFPTRKAFFVAIYELAVFCPVC